MIVSDNSLAEELYIDIVHVVCQQYRVCKHKNDAFTKCLFMNVCVCACVCVCVRRTSDYWDTIFGFYYLENTEKYIGK